ncbi:MAG: glycosyltransferase involved in cell wall biosynthesis [Planctomycetota bacterium]|jgi:glycosyltransferase involved in cell wall biosynthesis
MVASREIAAPRLLHVFATFDVGGPQVRTLAVRQRLGDRFVHGFVAADGRKDAERLLGASAAPVFCVRRPAGTWTQLRAMRAAIRTFRPDLVLTYNWGAMLGALAAVLARIPFVHHEEVVPPEERPDRLLRRDWLRRRLLPRARATVCVASTMLRTTRERWQVPEERCVMLPNAVDTVLHATSARGADDEPAPPLVVGCVANARPEKNWPRLLRAFALLPDQTARLLLVGDGPERAGATVLAQDLGIAERVDMVGTVADPANYYRRMHVFALPSDDEQHPLALLEAMAHGLPIVATDVGDVRATLPRAQHGFVVNPTAPKTNSSTGLPAGDAAFASGLSRLLTDRSLRRQLGDGNRRHVANHFDLAKLCERYGELYMRALARPVVLEATT